MINGTKQHYLFSVGGNVKTSGGVGSLAKGEFMIADMTVGGVDGPQVAQNLSATKKDKKNFRIYLGEEKRDSSKLRAKSYTPAQTFTFSLDQVKGVRVKTPKQLTPNVDEVIIGYNGHDPATSLKLRANSNPFNVFLQIKGIPVALSGGGNNYEEHIFSYPTEKFIPFNSCSTLDPCDEIPCEDWIYDLVETMRRKQISGGRELGDVIDITPIVSCATAEVDEEFTYWTLDVCDTGDAVALAQVQAQYPGVPIKRLVRRGSTTTYQTLIDSTDTLDDYSYSSVAILRTCDECPSGWDEVEGGFVYTITLEDDGTNLAVALAGVIPNVVTGSVSRQGGESGTGTGVYVALTSAVLTSANVNTILATYPTATVTYVSEKQAFCSDETTITIPWAEGETCSASAETYRITLPDNECGETRLPELQAAYPDNTITIVNSGNSTRTITLTGTSGTANVNVDGTDYLATFTTSLTVTGNNFVTSHAAAILADAGVTVTSSSGVLNFSGPSAIIAALTITNATTDLAGTLGTAVVIPANGGCMTTYQMEVVTNMVCDECDPVFRDYYVSERPEQYDGVKWTLFQGAQEFTPGGCLCGIKFRAKLFEMTPEVCLMYKYPYIEDSVEIEVSAGFTQNWDLLASGVDPIDQVNKQYLHRKANRDMTGGSLLSLVQEKNVFFHDELTGYGYLKDNMLGLGNEIVDTRTQYVQYSIDIADFGIRQGFAGTDGVVHTYNIFAEYGRHLALEAEINRLSAAAGQDVVQA